MAKVAKRSGTKKRKSGAKWYKMVSFFDGSAKSIMKVGGEDILLQGYLSPDNDVAVCLVPPSITHEQGVALEKILEAYLTGPVLVLTNNTQLVKLRKISNADANAILRKGAGHAVVQYERKEEQICGGEDVSPEGSQVRAGDRDGVAADLRSAGVVECAEDDRSSEASQAVEIEPRPAE